jgi:predicted transposase YbfD/YdcC
LDLDGAVVTFDALHTVRANLAWLVTDKKAHYIATVKRNQPLLHAQISTLPWRQVPVGASARETGHGRAETRILKAAHVSHLDFPGSRQAVKITRWRQDTATGKTTRQTVYAVTSLTSAHATAQDLARLVRERWSIEAHHHVRDVTFGEDAATSRTGSGPANLATIRAAVIAALKDAGYPHLPEGRPLTHARHARKTRRLGVDKHKSIARRALSTGGKGPSRHFQ